MANRKRKNRKEEEVSSGVTELENDAATENSQEPVETEIQGQEPVSGAGTISRLIDRARDSLSGEPAHEKPEVPRWKRYMPKQQREEITTLVSTVLAMLIAAWSVPDDLKPNDDEVNALSQTGTRLLLRHVNLSGRLTADALDIIGLVAVMAGWYTRTAPAWKQYSDSRRPKNPIPSDERPTDAYDKLFMPPAPSGA